MSSENNDRQKLTQTPAVNRSTDWYGVLQEKLAGSDGERIHVKEYMCNAILPSAIHDLTPNEDAEIKNKFDSFWDSSVRVLPTDLWINKRFVVGFACLVNTVTIVTPQKLASSRVLQERVVNWGLQPLIDHIKRNTLIQA